MVNDKKLLIYIFLNTTFSSVVEMYKSLFLYSEVWNNKHNFELPLIPSYYTASFVQ
jgi:hypothetical protein